MAWQKTEKKYENDIEKLKMMLQRVEELKRLTAEKIKLSSEKEYSKNNEKEQINALQTLDEKIISIKKKLDEMEKHKLYEANSGKTIIADMLKPKKTAQTKIIQKESKAAIESKNTEQNKPNKKLKRFDSDINPLKESISSLNFAIEGLIKLFNEANNTLCDDTDNAIISKLDKIIEQNNKIHEKNVKLTEAVLTMAEMLNHSGHNVLHNNQRHYNMERLPLSEIKKKQAEDKLSEDLAEKISHKEIRQIFSSDRNEQLEVIKNKMDDGKTGKTPNESKTQQTPLPPPFKSQLKPNLPESWEKEINSDDQNLKPIKKRPLKLNIAPRPPSFFGGDDSPSNTLSSFG